MLPVGLNQQAGEIGDCESRHLAELAEPIVKQVPRIPGRPVRVDAVRRDERLMMGFSCPSEQGRQLVWRGHQPQSIPVLADVDRSTTSATCPLWIWVSRVQIPPATP